MPKQPSRQELIEENEMLWSTLESIHDELADLLGDEGRDDDDEGE